MRYFFLVVLCGFSICLFGQNKKAKKLLDKVSTWYTSAESVEVKFDMFVTYPDEEALQYPSEVIQKGKKFLFRNSEQEYYGNGEDIWIYIREQNEVQINDFDEDESEDYFITPLDLLQQYKSGEYKYDLVGESRTNSEIEFVPKDEFSDYAKFKIVIAKKDTTIERIIAFGKDGSQVAIQINEITRDGSYDDALFEFDPSKYPGVRVEDLRLD